MLPPNYILKTRYPARVSLRSTSFPALAATLSHAAFSNRNHDSWLRCRIRLKLCDNEKLALPAWHVTVMNRIFADWIPIPICHRVVMSGISPNPVLISAKSFALNLSLNADLCDSLRDEPDLQLDFATNLTNLKVRPKLGNQNRSVC